MFKSYQIPVLYEMLSFMTMKVIIYFGKRFIKKGLEKVKLVLVNIWFKLDISMPVMVTNPGIGFGA